MRPLIGQQEQPFTPPPRAGLQGTDMRNFRSGVTAMVVVAAMAGSQALAADGILAPGKPAGVHEAQRSPSLLLIGGAAVVAVVGIAIAVSGSDNAACDAAHCPDSPTTGTGTTS